MSFRKEKYLTYQLSEYVPRLQYIDHVAPEELQPLFLETLYNGIHGLCFSLYEEGQKPGDIIDIDQIRRRMKIIAPFTKWIRSFSTTEGNELIPMVAREFGIKTLVGAWLGKDEKKNKVEIENLIHLANQGYVDVAAVGNEVLYRKDLTEQKLLSYIKEVKAAIPTVPVGYVDAYYEFVQRPEIADACDVILCNCYPYWEGTAINDAFQHMRQMYHSAKEAGQGKRVMITETGWPSQGEAPGGAVPSKLNAMQYFINTQLWSSDENIEIFYFSSFDESWKKSDEGEVGAYWGIWDSNGKLKY